MLKKFISICIGICFFGSSYAYDCVAKVESIQFQDAVVLIKLENQNWRNLGNLDSNNIESTKLKVAAALSAQARNSEVLLSHTIRCDVPENYSVQSTVIRINK